MLRILAGIIILNIFSCSPALYVPGEKNISDEAGLEELREGRRLYVSNCGSCHSLHLPGEFSAEAWDGHLEVMQNKAKISNAETTLIKKYLKNQK